MNKIPYKFVSIIWNDAHSTSGWTGQKKLPDVSTIVSRGWVIEEGKKYVKLAASLTLDEDKPEFGEAITIPKGCIVSRRRIP
jgi:hypothetical protein